MTIDFDKGLKAARLGDFKAAVKWYTLAAGQGHADSQHALGTLYEREISIPGDYEESVKWLTLAAEQGHAGAQCSLGKAYWIGKGTPRDCVRAYMWHSLAAYNGSKIVSGNKQHMLAKVASERKEWIANEMTDAQIAKAQEMANRCLETDYTDC